MLGGRVTHHGSDKRGRWAYKVPDHLLELARALRRRGTAPEALLWQCLRGRRMLGAKFRRQHIIGSYIADFYCHEARLVVELDGPSHRREDQRECDALRDEELQQEGFRVLRLQNEFVLHDPARALQVIGEALSGGPEEQPSPRGGK